MHKRWRKNGSWLLPKLLGNHMRVAKRNSPRKRRKLRKARKKTRKRAVRVLERRK